MGEIEMTEETKNAVIKGARIDTGDRNLLTAWIDLDYGGSGQSFGGHALYLPASYDNHELLSYAGHFIFRVMEIAGVERWSDLVGKTVRVRGGHSRVSSIGHIVKDDWFNPSADFSKSSGAAK